MLRTMIVEDDPIQSRMLQRMLEHRGHTVSLIAQRGDDERIGDLEVDVAVVDIGLPGRSGIDVIRVLSDRRVPCLVLSASAHSAAVTEALLAGALGYVVKGARLVEIVDALELVAKRHQVLPKHPRAARDVPQPDEAQ